VSQVYRYFEPIIILFAAAAVLAFLLNYPVQMFQHQMRLNRLQAVALVLSITCAFLIVLVVTLVPVVTEQTTQLLGRIPNWLSASQQNLQGLDQWNRDRNLPINLRDLSSRLGTQLETQVQTLLKQTLDFAVATLSGFVNGVLILVLASYMLLYGGRLWHGLIQLLPPHIGVPFSESLRLNFHKFFICQLLLSLFMALAMMLYFLIRSVPFAFLFALVIGVAELVPLVGATLGIGLVSLLLALQDVRLGIEVAIIAIILQQVRDNVLAPRMMGNFTGLNPIWIFVALLAGLQIAGFLGIIVAVPVAGTIKGTIDAIRSVHHVQGVTPTVIPKE
jgi:predicted PurR-regulated permease PerM